MRTARRRAIFLAVLISASIDRKTYGRERKEEITSMNYLEELKAYQPSGQQEEADKATILSYIRTFPDTILTRENIFAHLTASSMIFNETGDKVLMVYHNIYRSWSWTGGHADGETDMLSVALREAREETGIHKLKVLGGLAAVDVLPVWGHVKQGCYVSSHEHLNFSYLFQAEEGERLRVKEDENSQVGWIPVAQLREKVSEPDMIPVYEKLIRAGRMRGMTYGCNRISECQM